MGSSMIFKHENKQDRAFDFPIVAKSRNSNLVVLFSSEKEGTVLISSQEYRVGRFSNSWTNCFDPNWEILFEITITFKS